jgi:hypothetical protein
MAAIMAMSGCSETSPWQVKETAHLRIHYEKGSPAETDLNQLAAQFESYFQEASSMFAVGPRGRVNLFFHNTFPLLVGTDTVWGYCGKDGVHMAYAEKGKDSSPHELRHFFHAAVNPNAPYFFNEGACGLGINIGGLNFFQLAKATQATDQSLAAQIDRFGSFGKNGDYVAYSFCDFLIQRYGAKAFGGFYRNVTVANYRERLRELSGLPFSELEEQWKTTVRQTPVPESANKLLEAIGAKPAPQPQQ